MRKLTLSFLLILSISSFVLANNGLVTIKSTRTVQATADRLESILKKKGMTVFIRINHTEGALKVGKKLRPTELVIFGNPKVGTPLMQCSQTAGIDLPQKALIWEDGSGQVWLSYNSPDYVAERHNTQGCDKVLKKVGNALRNFSKAATM